MRCANSRWNYHSRIEVVLFPHQSESGGGFVLDAPAQINLLSKLKLTRCAPISGQPGIGLFLRAGFLWERSLIEAHPVISRPNRCRHAAAMAEDYLAIKLACCSRADRLSVGRLPSDIKSIEA